ncbi:nuclease domain-containing protein [Clostridium tagluense]|uniref:nuclease domain-containing protein n=1 Tax=Clostridium tagluense TaxID=360422 RepID=UPI001C6E1D27|nr:nuclease domain-containing protein [Clostridium tagluense]MBW9158041.1 hypothetical protein [Clostridium tagluense]WLC66469.1 hypothetical protein KTC93_04430 [Clostridium tagluense]
MELLEKEAGMTYSNNEGKKIELWYNKSYSKLPTASQRPDTVLCLKSSDNDERIYIFDAKYRLGWGFLYGRRKVYDATGSER